MIDALPAATGAAVYLAALTLCLNRITVALPRGSLNLTAIATNAAGMLLPVLPAAIVGAVTGMAYRPAMPVRIPWITKLTSWIGWVFCAALGSSTHAAAQVASAPEWLQDLSVIVMVSGANLIVTGAVLASITGESTVAIWSRNLSPEFFFAFAALGAAAAIVASEIRPGQLQGYLYATLVPVVAFALRSHISLWALRPTIQDSVVQVGEQSEYVHALESAMHDLRNLLMTAVALAPSAEGTSADLPEVLTEAVAVSRRAFAYREGQAAQFELCEVRDLASRALLVVRPVAADKKITLSTDIPAEPIHVLGDPLLLVELLTNLLINAVAVTATGGTVRLLCQAMPSGKVTITVEDSGGGFPASESLVVTAFGKRPAAGSGHGIGLRWCQTVAYQHLGRLVVSESGPRGSRIVLTLPPPARARQRLSRLQQPSAADLVPRHKQHGGN